MNHQCKHCGKSFEPHRSVSHQAYCSNHNCQKARKRNWQKQKLKKDPDYKANQKSSQKAWRDKNPQYMQAYRLRTPFYIQENRQQQRKRNDRRKKADFCGSFIAFPSSSLIVKMDELNPEQQRVSASISPLDFDSSLIVKMDELKSHKQGNLKIYFPKISCSG
ncbi:MAG: hypothetical protein AB1403_18915 [Candidatus Riflebacteria bacterium]